MSAIGDYVHASYDNYLIYSTSKFKQKNTQKQDLTNALVKQRERTLQKINSLPEIEPAIMEELKLRVAKNLPLEKNHAAAEKAAIREFTKEDFTNVFINTLNNSILSRDVKFVEKQTAITPDVADKVMAIRKKILTSINRINREGKAGSKAIQNLNNNFNEMLSYMNILSISENGQAVQLIKNNFNNGKFGLDDTIDSILYHENFQKLKKASLQGTLGEQVVAMSHDVADKMAQDAIEKELIKGEDRSTFKLDSSQVSKIISSKDRKDLDKQLPDANALFQAHASQNKVDVSIQVKEQNINASVKAYTPSSKNVITAHLQDINLLYTLAATADNFANHWLNFHANDRSHIELDDILMQDIAYEALVSGNQLKLNASLADTFVAIDVKGSRVYAQSTKNILKTFHTAQAFSFAPRIENIRFEQQFTKNKSILRISNLIMKLHQTKVKVFFRANLGNSKTT